MSTAVPAAGRGHDPWKTAFFGVSVVALAVGIAWALLGSSLLVVRSVQVTGSAQISRQRVIAVAGIAMGTPLIRLDTAAVARRVERITQVQIARVTRSWPDAVVIWVKRRTAMFAVPAHGGYDLVDSYGVVLAWAVTKPTRLVLLKAPVGSAARLRGNAAVLAAGAVVRSLPAWLRRRVTTVRATGAAAITLVLPGGVTVAWGGPGRAAAKAREMAVLLRTGASYYDVSDPVTAVTGPTGGPAG
ncbi:MAG TPA: FtsQ-type POTRA domain-containing protein [Streptosporangiaceae bacterium]|nr:FtsQ-type POTRA domain-containing protein [Streptosporangiaceae bacterium]